MESHALVLLAASQIDDNATAPGAVVTLTSAAIAFALAFPLRWLSVHALTAVHEGGHLLFGLWGGGRVTHVHVDRNGGGETNYGFIPPVDDFVASAMGYLGPPVAGLLFADILAHGRFAAVLWLTVAFLVFLLLFLRKVFGRVYVVLLGFFFVAVLVKASPDLRLITATAWTWYLMTAGMLDILVLWGDATDYDFLLPTFVSREGWAVVNLVLSVVAMIWGGLLLVGAQEPFL